MVLSRSWVDGHLHQTYISRVSSDYEKKAGQTKSDDGAVSFPTPRVQFEKSLAQMTYADQVAAIQPEMPIQFNGRPASAEVQDRLMESGGLETAVVQMDDDDVAPPAPVVPPAEDLSLATSKKILDDAFGSIKTFTPGAIQVLEQEAFKTTYDSIYAPAYAWDTYVVPTFGNLEGFAYNNTNYINKSIAKTETVVHEMLHNNTAADYPGVVGHEFNEGTTELLTIEACTAASIPWTTSYPGQTPVVRKIIAAGLTLANLKTAYLTGGAQRLVADWADANCKGDWSVIKAAMERQDFATAQTKVEHK